MNDINKIADEVSTKSLSDTFKVDYGFNEKQKCAEEVLEKLKKWSHPKDLNKEEPDEAKKSE